MPDKTATKLEVDPKNPNVIWICGVPVNPDQPARESMKGLPYNNSHVADLTPEMWGGDKDERAELAKAEITSETLVDIPIWCEHRGFTTDEARKALKKLGLGYGLPYCLDPLKDASIRKTLREEHNIWWVVALGQENKKLLQFEGYSRPVGLYLDDDDLGFNLGYAVYDWFDDSAVVGSPRKHLPK